MVRAATFCPACGESFEVPIGPTERESSRADASCPRCGHAFSIRPRGATEGRTVESEPRAAPWRAAPSGARGLPPEAAGRPVSGPGAAPERPPRPFTPAPAGDEEGPEPTPHEWTQDYPFPTPGKPARSGKPVAAGVLLLLSALLTAALGVSFAMGGALLDLQPTNPDDRTSVHGRVTDPSGAPVADVLVQAPFDNASTMSDERGRYRLDNVSSGRQELRFTKPGYENLTFVVVLVDGITSAAPQDVELRRGTGARTENIFEGPEFLVCGGVIFLLAVVTVIGAVQAFLRRNWGLALAGSITGIASIGFLIGAALALAGLVLLVLSRREFASSTPRA